MTRIDPIIAVADVEASSRWYRQIFGLQNQHGGSHFSVLTATDGEIVLCLHKWGEHSHPSLSRQDEPSGNGLLLYFRTDDISGIYENVKQAGILIEEDLHLNTNSRRQEFAFRDPDGYYLTVSEYHVYEG